ncbi:alpha/beta fold hydrolase [Microbulbifer epialgicus]|uniref:Proline iminopeptidase n=1 Tax=Microbulbifer epialgicus TaxID=393907 RepID=A0ABV4NYK6_9GAMM
MWRLFIACAVMGFLVSHSVMAAEGKGEAEDCYLDGWQYSLQCSRIIVGEGDTQVNLAVMVSPALDESGEEPLYLLAGGPGQAASDLAILLNKFRKINQTRAVVLVDRRGAGLSRPFSCGIDRNTPNDLAVISKSLAECYLQQATFANSLSSRQTIEDLELVRTHFGHEKIALWGGSWGTRTALLYQQWYPGSLSALVLDAVAPIDTKVFLGASAAEHALQILVRDCQADPACSQFGDWREILNQLLTDWDNSVAEKFPDPITGKVSEQPISLWALQSMLRAALYSPEASAQLPFAITEAGSGNYLPLAGIAGLFSDMTTGMSLGLTFSVACSEELYRISEEEAATDIADTFVGSAFLEMFSRGCDVWPVPKRPYSKPEARHHPVLLISGEADPITPPSYAQKDLDYLSNKQHLIVMGGGHINSIRGCIPELIEKFLKAPEEELDQACVEDIHRPPFMIGAYGPELDRRGEPGSAENKQWGERQ